MIDSVCVHGFTVPHIISWGDSVYDVFISALDEEQFSLETGDVIIVTSKVVSMEQQSRAWLEDVEVGEEAKRLATKSKMEARVAQLVIDESNGEIYGAVPHAILAKTRYGLSANAGIDLSNCPDGYALLLPRDPDGYAQTFRKKIESQFKIKVAVLITDSRTIPLKWGTTAVSLGVAGMEPLIDDRGKKDLYDYTMTVTTRAVADNLATMANLVMGETSERRPFAVIRNADISLTDNHVSMDSTIMPVDQCLYFAPLLDLIGD